MQSNGNFNKRFLVSCFVIWASFVLVFFIPETLKEMSKYFSRYVPVIKNQLSQGNGAGDAAASYFSIIVILVPLLSVFVVGGENFYLRIKEAARRRSRNLAISFLFLYLMGAPVSLLVLYAMYSASLDASVAPHLFGEYVAFFMATSSIGLFVFGGLAGMGALIFLIMLFALIAVPFQAVVALKSGK